MSLRDQLSQVNHRDAHAHTLSFHHHLRRPHGWDLLIGDESVRDPRLVERPDPTMRSQLMPSCSVFGRGLAYPPVRITGVARGIEEAGSFGGVQSICQDDFGGALDIFATQIISATLASCLPRPLDRAAGCEVIESLASGECDMPGRVSAGVDAWGAPSASSVKRTRLAI